MELRKPVFWLALGAGGGKRCTCVLYANSKILLTQSISLGEAVAFQCSPLLHGVYYTCCVEIGVCKSTQGATKWCIRNQGAYSGMIFHSEACKITTLLESLRIHFHRPPGQKHEACDQAHRLHQNPHQ
jgi:hypothetical protein